MIEVAPHGVYGCPEGICLIVEKDVPEKGRHTVNLYDGTTIENYPGYLLRERAPDEMPGAGKYR